MSHETIAKTGKKVKKRFRGICRDAVALEVDRRHLWAVLTGRRKSKSLMARYQKLKQQEEQQ